MVFNLRYNGNQNVYQRTHQYFACIINFACLLRDTSHIYVSTRHQYNYQRYTFLTDEKHEVVVRLRLLAKHRLSAPLP